MIRNRTGVVECANAKFLNFHVFKGIEPLTSRFKLLKVMFFHNFVDSHVEIVDFVVCREEGS